MKLLLLVVVLAAAGSVQAAPGPDWEWHLGIRWVQTDTQHLLPDQNWVQLHNQKDLQLLFGLEGHWSQGYSIRVDSGLVRSRVTAAGWNMAGESPVLFEAGAEWNFFPVQAQGRTPGAALGSGEVAGRFSLSWPQGALRLGLDWNSVRDPLVLQAAASLATDGSRRWAEAGASIFFAVSARHGLGWKLTAAPGQLQWQTRFVYSSGPYTTTWSLTRCSRDIWQLGFELAF